MRRVAAVLLALVAASACGRTDVFQAVLRDPNTPASEGPKRARAEVYVAGQTPPRPYYEVALLQAIGTGVDATMESVAQALAQRGGRLGCDAVVNVQLDQGVTVTHGYGVCVRWSPVAPAPATAPAAARDNVGDDGGSPL